MSYDVKARLDWFAGLLDSDGYIGSNGSCQVWSVDHDFLLRTKHMLSTLGIQSRVTFGKPAQIKRITNQLGTTGEYQTQDCWRLIVAGSHMSKLADLGLVTYRLDTSYRTNRDASRFIQVSDIEIFEDLDDIPVYCFTTASGRGTFNGIVTGQCGEAWLLPYEACVLGSLNLNAHIEGTTFNWSRLEQDVHLAIRFLDDMIEASTFPIPEIEEIVRGNRRLGLGIMGWADVLYKLEIPYDSPEAEAFADEVGFFVNEAANNASVQLAEQRGTFPHYEGSIWDYPETVRRNSGTTTIAPTGAISMIADCSAGIEPAFALVFRKNVMRDGDDNAAVSLRYANPVFEAYAKKHGFYSDALMEAIERNHGSLQITNGTPWQSRALLQAVPDDARRIFVTAHDVSPEWHVRQQSVWQMHTENAVSKTINFSHDATVQDVAQAYRTAYDLGCKGITVYRDGSRSMQVLTTSSTADTCPLCGGELYASEGCMKCTKCTYALCG